VTLNPEQTAADAYHGIVDAMRAVAVDGFEVDPVVVRHGFAADDAAVQPLMGAVDAASRLVRGRPLERAHPVYSSMWRDHNVFNMHRVPAVTTGMPRWRPTPDDLAHSALIYALTMLAVCGRGPEPGTPAGHADIYGAGPPIGTAG
jgi:hypothetical protein